MEKFVSSPEKGAGLIMLSSIVPLVILILLALRGEVPSLYGLFWPIEELAAHLPISPSAFLAQLGMHLLPLLGFGVLMVWLQDSGERTIPVLAFSLLIVSTTLTIFEATFYQGVNPWAALETEISGSPPGIYLALHKWMNTWVQMAYMLIGFLAYLGFGWSLLRTGITPSWVGWATIIWSMGWLGFTMIAQGTIPAGLFLWPIALGVFLIL